MDIYNRVKEKKNKYFFEKKCAEIRDTKPLEYTRNEDITVVSMVGSAALDMYLVAIKSFMSFFADANIEIINDGTLTPYEKKLLNEHIPGVTISDASAVDTKSCPDYSSWKRLFRIIDISKNSYVIQLDSDTVTLGPLVEVYRKAKANEGFMIGESHWSESIDLYHLKIIANREMATGPQGYSERVLSDLTFFNSSDKYLHGCAGFAGYEKGSLSCDMVESLSQQIEDAVGSDNWRRWGSEQAATNCLISKSERAETLPWPKYRNYMFPPTSDPLESVTFFHFIGSNRFVDTAYEECVSRFLAYYKKHTSK